MPVSSLAIACLLVFLAAVVRGFSGFGFTLLSISAVSILLPPATVVPAMWILDFIAGINLLPSIYRHVHWRAIALLVGASVVATPAGVYLLATVPTPWMRMALAILVLGSALLLLSGFQLKRMPHPSETIATGLAAGLLNGALGIGGPPIILFFLGSPIALEAGRASMIAAFLMDLTGMPALFAFGLITLDTLKLIAICLPALALGVYVGSRLIGRWDPAKVRRILLLLVAAMAVAIGSRAWPGSSLPRRMARNRSNSVSLNCLSIFVEMNFVLVMVLA
jgi:uncharacterized membrane protein YfcA